MTTSLPITLVLDGFFGSHHRWEPLCKRIEKVKGQAQIWTYQNTGTKRFEELGKQLVTTIQQLDHPVNLVGFSMGGLIIREALRQVPSLAVKRTALLCTPHHGSYFAWSLPLPAIKQIRPHSDFLNRLNKEDWSIPTFNVWCPADLMVFPGPFARWEKATTSYCSLVPAHAWPIYSNRIHQKVANFLYL